MRWLVQPAGDTGGMRQRQHQERMSGPLGRAQRADDLGKCLTAHRRIQALCGHATQRQHDLWLYQRDLPVQVLTAEPDLRR